MKKETQKIVLELSQEECLVLFMQMTKYISFLQTLEQANPQHLKTVEGIFHKIAAIYQKGD